MGGEGLRQGNARFEATIIVSTSSGPVDTQIPLSPCPICSPHRSPQGPAHRGDLLILVFKLQAPYPGNTLSLRQLPCVLLQPHLSSLSSVRSSLDALAVRALVPLPECPPACSPCPLGWVGLTQAPPGGLHPTLYSRQPRPMLCSQWRAGKWPTGGAGWEEPQFVMSADF